MMTDDEIVAQLIEELQALPPMAMTLSPPSVLHLVGLVQLALRHPHLGEPSQDFAQTFLVRAREYFADAPGALEVLRRGDDPSEDQ